MKTRVGIIGASGYVGAELLRILSNHPDVNLTGISSRKYQNQRMDSLYPNLYRKTSLVFEQEDRVIEKADVIFASLPHGFSEEIAEKVIAADKVFIDMGADFRLDREEDYLQWYHLEYRNPELHKTAVYGLPEINRELIKQKDIIANPGCYPTSIILGAYPILKKGMVNTDFIVIDSKSGVTGAGKDLSEITHFPRRNEAFSAYKVGRHRHTPEIEQAFFHVLNQRIRIVFVPHLLPVNRGILSTIYLKLNHSEDIREIQDIYNEFYSSEPFVRILPPGSIADLKYVQQSNYCDISLHIDKRTRTLIVISCIDNMVKGAAGQAIQNMNIRLGYAEDSGLNMIPAAY